MLSVVSCLYKIPLLSSGCCEVLKLMMYHVFTSEMKGIMKSGPLDPGSLFSKVFRLLLLQYISK